MTPIFDWSYALEILPTLGAALVITIQATVLGMLVAVTLGLALALLRRSRLRLVSWPAAFVIEFVRSTPLLVQMYFLFYVLPLTGLRMSPLATGCWRWACTTPPIAPRCTAPASKPCPGADRGRHRSEPAALARRWTWAAAGDSAGGACIGQLSGRHVQGHALAVGHHGGGAVAAEQDARLGHVPLHRAPDLVGALFLALSLLAAWGVRGLETRLQRHGGKR